MYASIDTAVSGDNTIVAANTANRIYVVSYVLSGLGTAISVRWKSGASTNLSGLIPLAGTSSITPGYVGLVSSPETPLMKTAVNNALVLNLSAAVQVSGHLSYILAP